MPQPTSEQQLLSTILGKWLASKQAKTLDNLSHLFAEKSFAIVFLILMALPALPLPTGGITHITEIITILLCLELLIGRRTVWLPERWLKIDIGKFLHGKAAERLLKIIRWFERFSRPRFSRLLHQRAMLGGIGFIILLLTLAAFAAPPFSGLDTLPALGVVIISLGLILEDGLLIMVGTVLGVAGIGLEIIAGAEIYHGLSHLL